jgi:hypothetical protein
MIDADNRRMDPQARIERFLLAAHRLARTRLRENPERVEELLATESVVCEEGEHETVLRSVSPIARLITTEERDRLLREAKQA